MMNKRAKVYTKLSLSLQDEIFRRASELAGEVLSKNKEAEREITEAISIAVADKDTEDGKLSLSAYDRIVLQSSLDKAVREVMGTQTDHETERVLEILRMTADHKYGTLQYIASLGNNNTFRKLSEAKRDVIVNQAISGKVWSDRIWTNKRALEVEVRREVSDLINGRTSSGKAITKIRRDFEISRNQSKRLINTEVARVQNEINSEYAREEGLTKQLFSATLDNATSDICSDLDGQVFDIYDRDIPSIPLHPNCRSVLINMPNDDWRPEVRLDNLNKETVNWATYNDWLEEYEES